MTNCNNFTIIPTPTTSSNTVEVVGISPIVVDKVLVADHIKYIIKSELDEPLKGEDGDPGVSPTITIGTVTIGPVPSVTNVGTDTDIILNIVLPKGKDGEPGSSVKGDPGITPTIEIGQITYGDTPSVSISGSSTDVILNFVLSKGKQGDVGPTGLVNGLTDYKFSSGGSLLNYSNMGNFTQGTYVDLGDNPDLIIRKVRVNAWVSVASMKNWTTLRLTSGNQISYNGSNLIAQRIKHSEGADYVGQWEIKAYIETTDRYIGFTFADAPGGNYSSDGEQYGDYGLEAFILK